MADISVVGIGNIIMRDEGLGVRAAEYLQKITDYPDFVQILDGGTLGMDLMPYIADSKRILFIDALNIDAPMGTYREYSGDKLKAYFKDKLSVHDLGLNDLLAVFEITERPIEEIIVIGIKPQIVELGVDMTEEIEAMIPEVAEKAKAIVDKWVEAYQTAHE